MEISGMTMNICRLCAQVLHPKSVIPLYTDGKQEQVITKQINQLVVDMVSPDDGLPQGICQQCSENVELCYSFVANMIETQNKLKRLMQTSKIKKLKTNDLSQETFLEDDQPHEKHFSQNELLSKNDDISAEMEFAVVDDFIELLVVNPDEMVEMEINSMLNSPHQFNDTIKATVDITDAEIAAFEADSISCMKEEDVEDVDDVVSLENIEDMEEDDAEDVENEEIMKNDLVDTICGFSVKEEPKEGLFTIDSYHIEEDVDVADDGIVELREQNVSWVYENTSKDCALTTATTTTISTATSTNTTTMMVMTTPTDTIVINDECSNIIYKCRVCSNTFDTEKSFQTHVCNQSTRTSSPVKKVKNVFPCELCNRVFKSKLVFKMHYSQHKKSNLCQLCNACFLDGEDLVNHLNEAHPYASLDENVYEEVITDSEKQCDVCGKITDNLKQHKIYHAVKELEYCKSENKKFLKKWFYCEQCNKKVCSEANFLFHVAKHNGEDTVSCRQCDYVAANIQDYNMHITTHTGGKYFICNDCEKCFFTRSAISDHVLIHMDGTRYMCEICGKRFKTSRSNAQHKLLQHKKYFRCNRCNRGFTHENKLKSHYNICRVLNQDQNESKVFEPVEKFFCNICNSNIKSSSEVSILFHKAKHEGKDGVECRFCNLLCKNACMYKNHLLIHTNQRPYACTQCPKSFRTKGCLVQHMLVHGDEYKYTCEYCGKKSKKLTTHVNHVNIHTDTKPYKCPDCDRPFRQLSDMKKHRKTHLKYKTDSRAEAAVAAVTAAAVVAELPYLSIKTEVEDMMAAESIQQLQLA